MYVLMMALFTFINHNYDELFDTIRHLAIFFFVIHVQGMMMQEQTNKRHHDI